MAVLLACEDAKRQLIALASAKLGLPPDSLEIEDGRIHMKGVPERAVKVAELFTPLGFLLSGGEMVGRGVYCPSKSHEDLETGQGKQLVAGVGYGANAVEVAVNVETGDVKVLEVSGCFDVGQPINPKGCEGIMEQGLSFGIGNALFNAFGHGYAGK
jgi:CO/xanthine dehydrogenase Mo-binding subunit